jgi:DNA-binding MarR family transcriptional regulator
MEPESSWLTEKQQRVWRGWLAMNAKLPAALHRELQADSGLSLQDFDVLVQLTDSAVGKERVNDLANSLSWERSRLSHHIKRMEARGLVEREECPDDGRGAFVAITPMGRASIECAAPAHAQTVRHLFFEGLTDPDLDTLENLIGEVLGRLQPHGSSQV